jgi:hypothetical protein
MKNGVIVKRRYLSPYLKYLYISIFYLYYDSSSVRIYVYMLQVMYIATHNDLLQTLLVILDMQFVMFISCRTVMGL